MVFLVFLLLSSCFISILSWDRPSLEGLPLFFSGVWLLSLVLVRLFSIFYFGSLSDLSLVWRPRFFSGFSFSSD